MAKWPSYTETRFPLIGLSQIQPRLWQFVSLDWAGGGTKPGAPAQVGPHYVTKAEAMGDLAAYAERNGYTEADIRQPAK